jgi:hypothetical protein
MTRVIGSFRGALELNAGRATRARRSDHSSAQLASAQLASPIPNTGAGTATLTKGGAVVEAAAVEGLPAIAATTIKTMIADPRFPDVFLAMSFSLSPHVSSRAVK